MTPLSKEFRLVVDYRMLNKQTIKDKYPLPDIEVMFDEMHGAKFFSSFDAVDGFWQRALGHLPFVRIFIDDVVVLSNTIEEHYRHVEQLLLTCREKGVFLKRSKVQLLKKSLRFLGHTISADGCRPQHDKTDASGIALGGVLVQDNGDGLRVIAYESRQFSAAEQSYHTVYAIPRSLLHHLFCELKLGGRLSEESVVAIVDLISVLAAQEDENAKQIQDTEADQPQGVAHVEDPQAGEVPYHQTV
ncbi:hypothetical protein CYMTET_4587 [Cymbomonas tetramitiformis]|uniref:Reverse transcriptase domain-containing protein n=1 Tax=Cymbomonas tetramitiformis TaxID=36881 RepID=A0AAE0H133_9CHLO|nr:hypothetical protein CYMTET_4587 [Cymbomonas tetramitiformis]